MMMKNRSVPLTLTFLEISPEAEEYLKEFFTFCEKKFAKGEVKHGYLRGDTDFRKIYNHFLEEVGELIFAVDGDDIGKSFDVLREAIIKRRGRKKDRNIKSELADVTNLPPLVYVCGKVQGVL